jgi:hypothetical protein
MDDFVLFYCNELQTREIIKEGRDGYAKKEQINFNSYVLTGVKKRAK